MYTKLWAIAVIRFGTAPKETLQGQLASTKLCTVTVRMMLVGGGGGHAAWTSYSTVSIVCADTHCKISLLHFSSCEQDMNLLLLLL